MTSNESRMVAEFHSAFGHPIAEEPMLLTMERARARVKWTVDEVQREFLEAIEAGDIVAAYDALLDGKYFIEGTAIEMGLDLEPGFLAVHRSNMAKLGTDGKPVPPDADGKVQKPEGWEPPEAKLAVLIEKQVEEARIYRLSTELAQAYVEHGEITLENITPGDVVKVIQGVAVVLHATNRPAFNRWGEEYQR